MKKIIIPIIGLGLVGLVVWFATSGGNNKQTNTNSFYGTTTEKKNTSPTDGTKVAKKNISRYVNYSQSAFEDAKDKKRVYFFHASWCPTCRVADQEFTSMEDKIPERVVLFKTNYDTEKELKAQYGITYQHVFVQVDKNGRELNKWSGGAMEELLKNLK